MTNQKTTYRGLAALIGLATAACSSAQDRPYAPGPQHPLKAPLPIASPFAKVLPRHLNVPPIPLPHFFRGSDVAADPSESRAIGYDPLTNQQSFESFGMGDLLGKYLAPGSLGSVPIGAAVPGQVQANTVFGSDDRQSVSNVTAFPWRANCKLYMRFPNGKNFVGSGALIGNKYVVTCGHCTYSSENGGWATRIEVVPGMYNAYRPYGSAFATYMRSYTGWTANKDRFYDIALVTLDRTIGNSTGWFGYAYQPNLTRWTVQFGGYDADRNGGNVQLYRYGPVDSDATTGFYYHIDMMGGASGSGVYYLDSNSNRYVVGVNGWESSAWNFATKITSGRFNDIKSWIASGK